MRNRLYLLIRKAVLEVNPKIREILDAIASEAAKQNMHVLRESAHEAAAVAERMRSDLGRLSGAQWAAIRKAAAKGDAKALKRLRNRARWSVLTSRALIEGESFRLAANAQVRAIDALRKTSLAALRLLAALV